MVFILGTRVSVPNSAGEITDFLSVITVVCRPCLSFASTLKVFLELTGLLNINSFPSHTTFSQLTNLSISTTWFLFNTDTTFVLHLQSLLLVHQPGLFGDHRSFFTLVLWNELCVELWASPNTVSFNYLVSHMAVHHHFHLHIDYSFSISFQA